MRVAFFSSYTGLGGGETSLLALLAAIDRTRVAPALVCPAGGLLPARARALGVQVRLEPWRLASVWFHPRLSAASRDVDRLGEVLDALGADAVHADFHALPLVVPAARRRRLPVVFTCYGWWFRPKPWQRVFYRQPGLTILAISEAVRRGFIGPTRWIDPSRVEVLPLGIDPDVHRPRPDERASIRAAHGLPVDVPLVTLVARFQRVKGHDVFLAMARRVLDAHPATRFAIAGDNAFGVASDEAFRKQVFAAVAADGRLREAVHLLGRVDAPQELVAASDVVVCSSRFESFGMAIVEAMAAAVPVVSTNVGGPAETMVDGETGFLVPPDRPELLAERVGELLTSPNLRERLGHQGRRRVVARFTAARYAARMSDVLHEALAGARR
jgi:glycosyltransferase involved in cell wall biosynthesis